MTNVIEFRRPMDFAANSVDDFILWLDLLQAHAKMALRKINGARSTEKVLAYYGDWLRRYWEANGAIRSLWQHLEEHVRVHGREIDAARCDEITDCMVKVEAVVKGARPWISLPHFDRAKRAAALNLTTILENLIWARGKAEAIGRGRNFPDERTPA